MKTKEVTYVYDVYDRRIAKDVDDNGNGTIDWGERYVYDGSEIALVYDRSDTLMERLLYGPGIDQPLASEDGSGDVLWFLADNQGTIRDVAEYDDVSNTTTVVNHIQYGGFGNITAQSNSSHEPRHTYTGREWDADAQLFYDRARWYDPIVGRFIGEDPIGFAAGDANLSRYVGNAPTNYVDPTGLDGVQFFGQTWVAPWSPNASWNALDNAGQYARATAGTFAGAVSAAVGGASVGGILSGGTPPGLIGGAVAGGVAGGAAGLWEAAWADDITQAMGNAALSGALNGPPAAIAPGLRCRGVPAPAPKWRLGDNKTADKFRRQMQQRGWTNTQIDDAIANGTRFPAINNVNPANGAIRHVHSGTGRSIVIDDVTGEVLHVGGDGFKY